MQNNTEYKTATAHKSFTVSAGDYSTQKKSCSPPTAASNEQKYTSVHISQKARMSSFQTTCGLRLCFSLYEIFYAKQTKFFLNFFYFKIKTLIISIDQWNIYSCIHQCTSFVDTVFLIHFIETVGFNPFTLTCLMPGLHKNEVLQY